MHTPERATRLLVLGLAGLTMLTACTVSPPRHPVGSVLSASSTPQQVASSAATPEASAPADPTADPAAFASDLSFTDITTRIREALGSAAPRNLTFARAVLTVPLDWAHPRNGKTVSITVVRIRATNQRDRIGSLVINPGGPGASGVEAAIELAVSEFPAEILQRFDIIGFDPRGVGLSSPLRCIPDTEKDAELELPADPTTSAQWQLEINEDRRVADECYAKYGTTLTFFSTTETVRDLEALRAKLGDAKLTYLGYSYGTLLGAEYASAYPDRVRALVLDGAVDPTLSTVEQTRAQAAGFALAFQHYAADCVAHACPLGKDPAGYVEALMHRAAGHPIPSGNTRDHRVVKDQAVLLAVISALYNESQWSRLTRALVDAAHGDGSGILALDDEYNERNPDGSYTNIEDANAAISCADTTQRPTVQQAEALAPVWRADNPLFGGAAAAGLGFCSLWKAPPDTPITIGDHGAPPILVIGTTGDPATPISGAEHLARLLGSGHLLVWNGEGHTAYPKTTCVTDYVDAYLIDLRLPPAGASCPAG
ncbi:tripeptidyl-peptidase B [Acidothermus cellulolyticus 11B]|uniref:Tripeptidyl-peptidase B n=1 Tax=Acidothermus cellulolyticus (strain ATCC 43068 / DSM 8971 / 11B) TaxID=351607 RepID=A0LQY2_ACIC1|nr:alpha/beta hydrolase [Acidothermus cellulolyticus]ABK51842.1 tripeptidyl-peptidase B [Acidothermus cellulolyticus 11B]